MEEVKRENFEEGHDDRKHGRRPDYRDRDRNQGPRKKDFVKERLDSMSGPTTNLQTKEGGTPSKKFTGRCRLFIGNLPNNISDEDFKKMFEQYGEVAEIFLHKQKGFGFVKLDTRQNAEAAKAALDFSLKDGKYLRVRFATHGAALKVKNLTPWVSNELLEQAFSTFGEVERAVVIVDDRGRPVGEGIVEYSRKQAAQAALKRCMDGCFLLTSSPRPVLVEPLEQRDEDDGLPEKNFPKTNKQYCKEREIGPRLAEMGTFEFEFATRWKKLYELEQQKRDNLEKEIIEGRHQLEDQMEYAIYEHEANVLRERLRHMEEQSSLIQREREIRREEERRREDQRRQEEMMIRQQQEEILRRRGEQDMRRRQEDNLMMQEAALRQMQGSKGMPSPGMSAEHAAQGYGPGGPAGGMPGPNGMMQNPGMGMQPRQSRFDQPPSGHHMGGPPGPAPMNNMGGGGGGPAGGPAGNINNMRGGAPMPNRGVPREMMEGRDPREEYADAKRRRY